MNKGKSKGTEIHLFTWAGRCKAEAEAVKDLIREADIQAEYVVGLLGWRPQDSTKPATELPGAFFLDLSKALEMEGWEHLSEALIFGEEGQIRLLRDKKEFRAAMISENDTDPSGDWSMSEKGSGIKVSSEDHLIRLIQDRGRFGYAEKIGAFKGAYGMFEENGIKLIEYKKDGQPIDWRLTVPGKEVHDA